MAQVHFTSWLRELVPDGPLQANGATVGAALDAVFAARPLTRGYVLDDRGRLRKHVCVFVDGARLKNADALGRAIGPHTTLHVMQALSGR
jgi:molybdopterin synthase sulfur carrier subunit